MGRLLLFNFGTYEETNRFKALGLSTGFLSSDAMEEETPGSLVQPGGMRRLNAAGTVTYSLHGLTGSVWRAATQARRRYYNDFKSWMERVVGQDIHCVYLTGHHSGARYMYWDEESEDFFWLTFRETAGTYQLRFGSGSGHEARGIIAVDATHLRSQCCLVVGFGCNLATADNSVFYQRFFHHGAERPVVLGWASTMEVPRRNWPSINERFYDYLRQHSSSQQNVSQGQCDSLEWFYEHHPDELVRAWGYAVLAYRSHSRRGLWTYARARAKDGAYYRFDYKDGSAEPVRA